MPRTKLIPRWIRVTLAPMCWQATFQLPDPLGQLVQLAHPSYIPAPPGLHVHGQHPTIVPWPFQVTSDIGPSGDKHPISYSQVSSHAYLPAQQAITADSA